MKSQLSGLRLLFPLLRLQTPAGNVLSPRRQFTTTEILRSTANRLYTPYVCTLVFDPPITFSLLSSIEPSNFD